MLIYLYAAAGARYTKGSDLSKGSDVMAEQPSEKRLSPGDKIRRFFERLFSRSSKKKEKDGLATEAIPQPAQQPPPDEDAAPPPPKDEPVKAAGNCLYELYNHERGVSTTVDEEATFSLTLFTEEQKPPEKEQRGWLIAFEKNAVGPMRAYKTARELEKQALMAIPQDGDGEETEPQEPPEPESLDAQLIVKINRDKMQAWVFLVPPVHDGEKITMEAMEQALSRADVRYGVDKEKVRRIVEEERYLTLFEVAKGTAAINGEDGYIVDHFYRDVEIRLEVKDDNTINYKDLGWLQTITKDQVICDIVAPTEGTPGYTIYNSELKGRDGRKAKPPNGPNTLVNLDETAVIAAQDGVLSFKAGRFQVDPLLVIKGDVGLAVGNLDVLGDVVIEGDVLEGYTVGATGNITIKGMVEGALVVAGGDVQIGSGMNGNGHGVVEAGGKVHSKFIENGTVRANNEIVCDTIIHSTIESDVGIRATTGRGTIIGGQLTATKFIDATTIGNLTHRYMEVRMGNPPDVLEDRFELELKQRELQNRIAQLQLDVEFLQQNKDTDTPEIQEKLEAIGLERNIYRMELANVERQLGVVTAEPIKNSDCRLMAETIHPPFKVSIGEFNRVFQQSHYNAIIYYKEGEIEIANV